MRSVEPTQAGGIATAVFEEVELVTCGLAASNVRDRFDRPSGRRSARATIGMHKVNGGLIVVFVCNAAHGCTALHGVLVGYAPVVSRATTTIVPFYGSRLSSSRSDGVEGAVGTNFLSTVRRGTLCLPSRLWPKLKFHGSLRKIATKTQTSRLCSSSNAFGVFQN